MRTLTKASIPAPGQQHSSEASPHHCARQETCGAEQGWDPVAAALACGQPTFVDSRAKPATGAERVDAFVEEALKTIHEVNEGAERRQLGIIENPQKSWLWDFDFMKLNQRSLDTTDVEAWTDVDYLTCFREASRPRSFERGRYDRRPVP